MHTNGMLRRMTTFHAPFDKTVSKSKNTVRKTVANYSLHYLATTCFSLCLLYVYFEGNVGPSPSLCPRGRKSSVSSSQTPDEIRQKQKKRPQSSLKLGGCWVTRTLALQIKNKKSFLLSHDLGHIFSLH